MGDYYRGKKNTLKKSLQFAQYLGNDKRKKIGLKEKSSSFHMQKHNTQEPESFTQFLRSLHHHRHFILHADDIG